MSRGTDPRARAAPGLRHVATPGVPSASRAPQQVQTERDEQDTRRAIDAAPESASIECCRGPIRRQAERQDRDAEADAVGEEEQPAVGEAASIRGVRQDRRVQRRSARRDDERKQEVADLAPNSRRPRRRELPLTAGPR